MKPLRLKLPACTTSSFFRVVQYVSNIFQKVEVFDVQALDYLQIATDPDDQAEVYDKCAVLFPLFAAPAVSGPVQVE